MSGELPTYNSTDEDPPEYTSSPLPDERTIAHNPRLGDRNRNGRYVKSWKQATLILKDQDETSRFPIYSRGAIVNGEIGLTCPESIVEVSVKLFGHMSVMAADCGTMGAILVSDSCVLWSRYREENIKARCPSILPFSLRFPYTFKDSRAKAWKLPPSFESTFLGIHAMFAKCTYTLTITLTKAKRYALTSWHSSRMFNTMLDYRPRTRPQRPIVMVGSIFASIKPMPEEWQQHILKMEPRSGSNAGPVECHFLISSVQTYSISDVVPFHIQLRGSLESLDELVPPNSCLLDPRTGDEGETLDLSATGPHGIRVYFARQIQIELNGRKRFRTYTVGTSQMWPVPPVMTDDGEQSNTDSDLCLDWQGELKCREDVITGSFCAGMLSVRDFVVVGLAPPHSRSSFLMPAQLIHPIKLTTDSWMDLDTVHPRDV